MYKIMEGQCPSNYFYFYMYIFMMTGSRVIQGSDYHV